jgi:hypothetical protein
MSQILTGYSTNRPNYFPVTCGFFFFLTGITLTISGFAETNTPDPNETETVRGRVVETNGQGLAGVSVEMYSTTDQGEFPYPIKRLKTETTDSKGWFTLSIPDNLLDIRKVFVVAHTEGVSVGWEQLSRIVEESRPVILSHELGTLEGTVANLSGQAIANATVHAVVEHDYIDAHDLVFAMASTPMMTTTTGVDGRFTIRNLPLSARAEIVVIAETYPKTFSWRTDQGLERPSMAPGQPGIQILLSRETAVYGQLIDASTRKPIVNEKVYLICHRDGRTLPALAWHFVQGTVLTKTMGDDNRECVTTPNGVFVATGLPAGQYCVGMDPFTHPERQWIVRSQLLQVEEGKVVRVNVAAIRPAIVKLICLDRDNQKPVEGVKVQIVSISEPEKKDLQSPPTTTTLFVGSSITSGPTTILKTAWNSNQTILDPVTDAQGRATMTLMPGRYRIESTAKEGYKRDDAPVEFEAHSGEEQTVKVPVVYESDKVGVWGTCVDQSGRPLAGVQLRILSKPEISSVSDSTGHFQFQIPEDQDRFRLEQSVLFAEHTETGTCVVLMKTGLIQKDHSVTLKPSRSLTGQVLAPSGVGIDKVALTVYLSCRPSQLALNTQMDETFLLPVSTHLSGPGGVFRIGFLDPEQTYVLQIQQSGYGRHNYTVRPRQWMTTFVPESTPGIPDKPTRKEPTTPLDLDLGCVTLSPSNLDLSGIVVNVRGKPIGNMRLGLSGFEQTPGLFVVSDPNGHFRFDHLTAGKVVISFPGELPYRQFRDEFAVGSHDLRIVLTEEVQRPETAAEEKDLSNSALVRVSVIDNQTSKPICCASIQVKQPGGSDFDVDLDEQGKATFHIGKGHYTIIGELWPAYSVSRTEIESEIGKEYSVELRLYPRRKILGNILSEEGKPVGNARVYVENGTLNGAEAKTENNGRFELWFDTTPDPEGFEPYLKAVFDDHRFAAVIPFPETDEIITIQLQPTATLTLRTRNAAGEGVKTDIEWIYLDGKRCYSCQGQQNSLERNTDTHTIAGLVLPPGRHFSIRTRYYRNQVYLDTFDIPDELIIPGATSTLDVTVKDPKPVQVEGGS